MTHLTWMAVLFPLSVILSAVTSQKVGEWNIYWNVPTEACHKHSFNFSELLAKWNIVANTGGRFRGDRIVILYDPGDFPFITESGFRNGGVPQEGDLEAHLQVFKKDIEKAIPDKNFNGIGVIDFEHWRPVWRQNWASLDIYRQQSIKIEKKLHPNWSTNAIEESAKQRFERAGYSFIRQTLLLAKRLRPKAAWGYYQYPQCFNFAPTNNVMTCPQKVMEENDRSKWMSEDSTALFPSVYLPEKTLSEAKRAKLVQGRVTEGVRVARQNNIPVLPYTWFKYHDTDNFLSKVDMKSSIGIPRQWGASGAIVWGSSKDVNTMEKCKALFDYVDGTLGPIVAQVAKMQLPSNDVIDD